jgi:CRISPR/Cas system CSM-associated protein Csm3 (group 7 of RAMP superfamily)
MTEQPSEQNNDKPPAPQIEKLLIDNLSNFQFHAAYLVYSESFDKLTDEEAKKELNRNLEDLESNKIDYETFYLNISRYRKLGSVPFQEKFSLPTQRKKDWRMKTQRQERIKRHKK